MKIVVIGATGMLGQALYCEGQRRDFVMMGVARTGTDFSVDITDSRSFEQILESVMPDIVINAAAITSLAACENNPGGAYLVNARAVAVMANLCMRHGSYFIQISTDHYFRGDGDGKHAESAQVSLVNEYAMSKYAGESFALTCPNALIIRTNIIGFRRRGAQTFVEWAIQSLENGSRMTLFEDFFTSSLHVGGFAAALFDLIPAKTSGILNLASKEVSNKKQFIEMLADALGFFASNVVTGSVESLTDARRANSLGLDVSKAEALLGYDLPTARQVVGALANEYRRMK